VGNPSAQPAQSAEPPPARLPVERPDAAGRSRPDNPGCAAAFGRCRIRHHNGENVMGMMSEFREFALKGNVMDLAVGVIIGGAFGKIVDSLVKDVIMPLVNFVAGGQIDFSNKYYVLAGTVPPGAPLAEAQKAGTVFAWGSFVTVAINFVILAFIIFWMVRTMNRMKREAPPAAPAAPAEDVVLLREIRDALKR
jgi:large conductance mechanosensitive channel